MQVGRPAGQLAAPLEPRLAGRRWSAASPVSDQEVDEWFGPPERTVDGRSICVVECRQDHCIVCADSYLVQPAAPVIPVDDCDASAPGLRGQVHADGRHEFTVASDLCSSRVCLLRRACRDPRRYAVRAAAARRFRTARGQETRWRRRLPYRSSNPLRRRRTSWGAPPATYLRPHQGFAPRAFHRCRITPCLVVTSARDAIQLTPHARPASRFHGRGFRELRRPPG
jgi:hypothetical protein